MSSLKIFSLDNYFNKTNKYYYFFDGMFKYQNLLKKEVLIELKIPPSTYRLNRIIDNAKNFNHISLLKYFKINNLDKKLQIKYEMLLSRLYMAVYYKYDVQECYDKLEEYINQNNYLKPIFVLFRILYKMNGNKSYSKILDEINDDIEYIYSFPREYFENELEAIYLDVLLFGDKINESNVNKSCYSKYPNLLWIYYHILGTISFTKNDFSKAILFYNEASKLYFNDNNVKRYLVSKINIALMYNDLNLPQFAVRTLSPTLNYILNEENRNFYFNLLILHYIMGLFMLEEYKEIILFNEMYLKNNDDLKVRVSVIAVIASYYLEEYKKEDIDNKLIEFCDLTKKFYEYIYDNLNKNEEVNSIVSKIPYLIIIKNKVDKYKIKLLENDEK